MTQFYRNLQIQPDKAQALRQAMLSTKEKYPNPIDWAAFTLIGEAELMNERMREVEICQLIFKMTQHFDSIDE